MSYYTEVKGFISTSFTGIKNGFDHYYPVVCDNAKELFVAGKELAGKGVVWIKDRALENPATAVGVMNAALILSARKIHSAIDYLLSFVLRGERFINTRKGIANTVVALTVIGANAALVVTGAVALKAWAIGAAVGGIIGYGMVKYSDYRETKKLKAEFELRKNVGEFMKNPSNSEIAQFLRKLDKKTLTVLDAASKGVKPVNV
jgi:hypothetical protein